MAQKLSRGGWGCYWKWFLFRNKTIKIIKLLWKKNKKIKKKQGKKTNIIILIELIIGKNSIKNVNKLFF